MGAELQEPEPWATLTAHDSVIFQERICALWSFPGFWVKTSAPPSLQDNDFEVFVDANVTWASSF